MLADSRDHLSKSRHFSAKADRLVHLKCLNVFRIDFRDMAQKCAARIFPVGVLILPEAQTGHYQRDLQNSTKSGNESFQMTCPRSLDHNFKLLT
jgi:hypothetical protein